MPSLRILLLILAAVFKGLAALGVNPPRLHLGWLGLSCFFVAMLPL